MPSAVAEAESIAPSNVGDMEDPTSFRPKTVPKWLLLLVAVGMLSSGSFDSIITKFMNKQILPTCDGCEPKYFEAPFFQTWTMYIGESLCFFAYHIDKFISKRRGKANTFDFPTTAVSYAKPRCPKYMWVVPMTLDFIASTMINYAFIFAQVSTVQMLRNVNVILTAFLTLVYLRKALRIHQYIGVVILTLGMILVGLYSILYPDKDTNHKDLQWLGLFMAVVGTCISAFQYVFEERLFRKYYCSPFESVGLMGIYGTILGSILLIVTNYGGAEDVRGTFYQMGLPRIESHNLIIANVFYVVSISIFNGCGLTVTKLASGLLRTILNATRTITIWIIELILKWNIFRGLNFGGLVVIMVGVFIYNYNFFVVKDSWAGDKYLRKALVCFCLVDPDKPIDDAELEGVKSVDTDNSLSGGMKEVMAHVEGEDRKPHVTVAE